MTPPSVTLTSPAPNAFLRGPAQLQATTTPSTVDRVEFYDGTTLLGTDTTAPYAVSWNTTSASDGAHTLSAKAYLSTLSGTSSAVPVTIDNTAPTSP